jgi:hypothetical protein
VRWHCVCNSKCIGMFRKHLQWLKPVFCRILAHTHTHTHTPTRKPTRTTTRTHTHTHTHSSVKVIIPCHRPLPTQHKATKETNIRAFTGIRPYDQTKQALTNISLRPHGQRERLLPDYSHSNEVEKNCDFLGHCSASSAKLLPTFPYNLSVSSSAVKKLW